MDVEITPAKRGLLPLLAFAATFSICAMTQGRAEQLAQECALKEVKVITLIEDHGAAQDLPADLLGNAGLTMMHARSVCYAGRVEEALALYQSILDIGPVVSLNQQRP
jgi:hypothetical protein